MSKETAKKPAGEYADRCPNCNSDRISVWQDGGYHATSFPYCPDCG